MNLEILPWLTAMTVLIACSAFFSASEAALFYLRSQDRRALRGGGRAPRAAAALLADPDRLLSAVLFWNLVINISYFAMASIAGLRLQRQEGASQSSAAVFAIGSLLAIIFFSEMLPKSLAVVSPRRLASLLSIPLSAAVRLVDPLMPVLRTVNLLSRRLIWPRFRPEPYLEVTDLERAIEVSTADARLVEQERAALRNIVLLSDTRVDEWMRPRTQYRVFRPPVSLADLGGRMTPSGYLLISETKSEDVASAIALKDLSDVPSEHLEHYAEPVLYTPWCAPVADVLQQMRQRDRAVAAVVNEFGETIGVATFEDILDTIFSYHPSRSGRLLDREAIEPIRPGVWRVAGMSSLRRVGKYFDLEVPYGRSVTVAGVVQETLQRVAEAGDECDWGPFHFRVLEAPGPGLMLVELSLREGEEDGS